MTQPICCLCESAQSIAMFTKSGYTFCHCPECGLIYLYPKPEEDENIYNMDYYQKRSILNATSASSMMHTRHLEILETYASHHSLLDIGCGTGYFMNLARSRGWNTEGIDISAEALCYARRHYGLNVHNYRLSQLPKKTYDVITLWDVIEHLCNPLDTLSVIYRLLKPDGILAVSTPNVYGISTRLAGKRSSIFSTKDHLFYFSARTLRRLIEKTGFKVIKIMTETIYIRNIALILSRMMMKDDIFYPQIHSAMQKGLLLRSIAIVNLCLRIFKFGDQLTVFACRR